MNPKQIPSILALASLAWVGQAQIAQDRPDLCGSSGTVALPPGLSIVTTPGEGSSILTMADRNWTVQLPGVESQIRQVCPLASDKLLMFGWADGPYNIMVVDIVKEAVVDFFYASDPAVSPDQHWIASRAFYPPQSEVKFSENYVVYDLTKDAEGNNLNPSQRYGPVTGRSIYPVLKDGSSLERSNLGDALTHSWRSNSFYWSKDSRYVAFSDSVGGKLSIVLADSHGWKTLVHQVTAAEACQAREGRPFDTSGSQVSNVAIGPDSGGARSIEIQFSDMGGEGCVPRNLLLGLENFQPAPLEMHKAHNRQPSIPKDE